MTRKKSPTKKRLSKAMLARMIEEATVDAYDEHEQALGFSTLIEDNLALPFETTLLGIEVTVEEIDTTPRNEIVAVCKKGRGKQRIPILDLPLPSPPPESWEWIEAYRHWCGA